MGAVFLLAGLGVIPTAAAPRPAAAKTAPLARGWLQGNRVRLTVAPPGAGKTMTYTFSIASGGDMRIGIEEREGRSETTRELLLISGRFLAVRGTKLPPGYEIDALDAAALSWQLAGQVLARAAPGDPATLRAPVRIVLDEPQTSISVSTNSAEETFPAPWTSRGRINPIGDGRLDFDFVFSYHASMPPSEPVETRYSGRWESVSPAPAIEDRTKLTGWALFTLGSQKRRETDGSETIDFGASPAPSENATVGDLRRRARAARP